MPLCGTRSRRRVHHIQAGKDGCWEPWTRTFPLGVSENFSPDAGRKGLTRLPLLLTSEPLVLREGHRSPPPPPPPPGLIRETLTAIFNISSIKCPEIELHKQIGGKSVDLVTMEANPPFQPCLLCNYGAWLVPLVPPGQICCGPLIPLHPESPLEEATLEPVLGEAGVGGGVARTGVARSVARAWWSPSLDPCAKGAQGGGKHRLSRFLAGQLKCMQQ